MMLHISSGRGDLAISKLTLQNEKNTTKTTGVLGKRDQLNLPMLFAQLSDLAHF